MKKLVIITLLLLNTLLLNACVSTSNNSPAQKRAEIQKMSKQVLTQIYKETPRIRTEVNKRQVMRSLAMHKSTYYLCLLVVVTV